MPSFKDALKRAFFIKGGGTNALFPLTNMLPYSRRMPKFTIEYKTLLKAKKFTRMLGNHDFIKNIFMTNCHI